jgi:hypothetical protein
MSYGVSYDEFLISVHWGGAYQAEDFYQQTSRVSHDGRGGLAYVLVSPKFELWGKKHPSKAAFTSMINTEGCRRRELYAFLDAEGEDGSCTETDLYPCDNCSGRFGRIRRGPELHGRPHNLKVQKVRVRVLKLVRSRSPRESITIPWRLGLQIVSSEPGDRGRM